MKKWFTKFPYPGLLLVLLVLLAGAFVAYHLEEQKYTPESLSRQVQKDFSRREAILYVDALTGFFNRHSNDSVIPDTREDAYYYFLIHDGCPVNWNTDKITLPPTLTRSPDSFENGQVIRLNHVTYYLRALPVKVSDSSSDYALTFIPLAYHYSFENKYFKSHFVADEKIPPNTIISNEPLPHSIVIKDGKKQPAFYLRFQSAGDNLYTAGFWAWFFGIATLVCFFILLHQCCRLVAARTRPIFGWLLLFLSILVLSYFKITYGLPDGFANSLLFSSRLLASGDVIHSFGDLVMLTIFDTWMVVFYLKYVPVNHVVNLRRKGANAALNLLNAACLTALLFFIQAGRIYKLVIDSKISFEVSDFSRLSVFTFLGIAVLVVITINFIFILRIINGALKAVFSKTVFRYLVLVAFGLVCMYLLSERELTFFYATVLFMCVAGVALLDAYGMPVNLFSENKEVSNASYTYVWFIILCSWITIELFYFNYSKEKELRKVFATKQEQREDALVSFLFESLTNQLQQDPEIKSYWQDPEPALRSKINKRIIYRYLRDRFNKFDVFIYYFDEQLRPLRPADSTAVSFIRMTQGSDGAPLKNGIAYLDDPDNKNVYWGIFPVLNRRGTDTLGFMGFDFAMQQHPRKDFIASLLQQNYNPTDQQYFDKYVYGIYRNGKLWTQGERGSFPFLTDYPEDAPEYKFKESLFSSTLYYKPAKNELIQVYYERNLLAGFISLFSYVLAVVMIMGALVFVFSYFVFHPLKGEILRRRRINLTIRSKVNLTILVTVFLSLLVVGAITVSFLKGRYREDQQKNLKNLMFYFSRDIVQFIEAHEINLSDGSTDSASIFSELNIQLSALSNEQGVDINLYNKNGRLVATSQNEMLQKGFLESYMDRAVLTTLRSGTTPDITVSQSIGTLEYQSLYLPLRNKSDEIIAYLNLPYYASQPELNKEISNILATLINIYTLIFFISGISAILISNSIIKSFRLLIKQFRVIRLKHNVLINWPYRDELSLLVREYNDMIIKVEKMAAKLASNEREAAWRELALQVAHEIKNPLTPMKLNIQYLQSAIRSGRQDVTELTARLTSGLIDQIENLNVIASEFAHFAKMPEAQPEVLKLHESLLSITALFEKEKQSTVRLVTPDQDLKIVMDKGYFMRIFTNLVKNALQAIPEGQEGLIDISYKKVEKKVIILVKDNGVGIPEELREKMFVPYFTTKTSGTGIGLSMSKNIVEHSNGRIWFETTTGKGTTFFIQLPLV